MTGKAQFLPQGLEGKTIGVLSNIGPLLGPDLKTLSCEPIFIDPLAPCSDYDMVEVFVLDCIPMLQRSYPIQARAALDTYARLASNRYCFSVFPYGALNYDWDVTNHAVPQRDGGMLPSARWIYDILLSQFAARAVANASYYTTKCIVTRVLPLKRTLVCIMATSGHGKTTLVRALKNQCGMFHTSSDYLLSTIINVSPEPQVSNSLLRLKQVISSIPAHLLWSTFFRLLDEDHVLLRCFLDIAWQHMALAPAIGLMSFDIDLREDAAKREVAAFFKAKDLKVWECSTS